MRKVAHAIGALGSVGLRRKKMPGRGSFGSLSTAESLDPFFVGGTPRASFWYTASLWCQGLRSARMRERVLPRFLASLSVHSAIFGPS